MNHLLNSMTPASLGYASLMFVSFMAAMFLGTIFLPGKVYASCLQPNNTRKSYKLNGLLLFMITTFSVVAFTLLFHFSLASLSNYFWSLFIVANLFAFTLTGILYVKRRGIKGGDIQQQSLVKIFSDLWFGVELNPTWLGVNLKMFAYQPSLIGLGLLNASFAYVQYEKYSEITLQMWMFQVFWWLYLATHYYYEEFMLSTWDIIAEKFGFMLVWGDLVLVPFFYSIIGWYLVDAIAPMSVSSVVAISLLYLVGLTIFRDANAQKHRFKKNPKVTIWGQPAQALEGKLLISGWWGVGRKLNYSGEICVYLALALTTGFDSIIPYLLPLWLCVLLPHRAWRDEQRCQAKYGNLWDAYCAKVRFRMLPFMY
ncbi:hypothetical protein [uncultured Nostoc sp.]|uniref:hypothetical protein n=1 Tax=uncultured Nostoc sp. TaxID=340711 RepID=UPI0035CC4098